MGIRDELRRAQERLRQVPPHARPTVTRPVRRRLHEDDKNGWLAAAEQRDPPRKRDKDTLRAHLKKKNPRRWRALQRHLRWVENEMLALGVNPEDARWLL